MGSRRKINYYLAFMILSTETRATSLFLATPLWQLIQQCVMVSDQWDQWMAQRVVLRMRCSPWVHTLFARCRYLQYSTLCETGNGKHRLNCNCNKHTVIRVIVICGSYRDAKRDNDQRKKTTLLHLTCDATLKCCLLSVARTALVHLQWETIWQDSSEPR